MLLHPCLYRCEESLRRDAGVSLPLPLWWVESAGRRADLSEALLFLRCRAGVL